MTLYSKINKCATHLKQLAQELQEIAHQVAQEAQLAQDAQAREEEIREETRQFLERLGSPRKRSGSLVIGKLQKTAAVTERGRSPG